MIAAFWIFLAFVLGGCAGLLLTALLRTAADQTSDAYSYFVSNPRVSADMIAMLRCGSQPNDPGRPLEQVPSGVYPPTQPLHPPLDLFSSSAAQRHRSPMS